MDVDSLRFPRPLHDPQHRFLSVKALGETCTDSRMTRRGFERFKRLVPLVLEVS